MRLLGVELTRFFTRRAVVLLLLAGVVLAAVMVGSTAYSTRPMSQAEVDAATEALEVERDNFDEEYDRCLEDPAEFFGVESEDLSCESVLPRLQWYLERAPLDLRSELDGSAVALLVLLSGLALVVGATFAGADWASGSMSNQLLFEPRRGRVWTAKAVAVGVGTALGAAVTVFLFWTGLLSVALARSIDIPQELWSDVLALSGRGVALVAAAGVGAYALTMLLRHTVGALGLVFAYVLAGEAVAATLPIDRMSQWSLAHNVMAWFEGGTTIYDPSICDGQGCTETYELALAHGAGYLGVLLLISLVASVVVFRRRDVP